MQSPKRRTVLKSFLEGSSKVLFLAAGGVFLIGDRILRTAGVDFLLSELLGIGTAAACLIAGVILKYKIEDMEWEEANEAATRESAASQYKPKS
jgi:hypothetical protein